MGVYSIKPAFQRSLLPLEDALVAKNVHPDVITLSALGLSTAGGAALAFSARCPWLLLTAPVVAMGRTALNAGGGPADTGRRAVREREAPKSERGCSGTQAA